MLNYMWICFQHSFLSTKKSFDEIELQWKMTLSNIHFRKISKNIREYFGFYNFDFKFEFNFDFEGEMRKMLTLVLPPGIDQ